MNWTDPWGLKLEKDIKELLDKNVGDKLTEAEKQKVAEFTGKQIGIAAAIALAAGSEKAKKKLANTFYNKSFVYTVSQITISRS